MNTFWKRGFITSLLTLAAVQGQAQSTENSVLEILSSAGARVSSWSVTEHTSGDILISSLVCCFVVCVFVLLVLSV